jgi:hypothetical protein
MEVTRKRGRPCKRWTDKVEEGLHIMGIKNTEAMVRDSRELRKVFLKAKVHNGLYCLMMMMIIIIIIIIIIKEICKTLRTE